MPPRDDEDLLLLDRIQELARLTAAPLEAGAVFARGLDLLASSLAADSGLVVEATGGEAREAARFGVTPPDALRAAATTAALGRTSEIDGGVAVPIPGDDEPVGALALRIGRRLGAREMAFLRAGVGQIAAALAASRSIEQSARQSELLSERNTELEALRELVETLAELENDEAILRAGLDLVLDRLRLDTGWILLGRSGREELTLAVHRGLDAAFVTRAASEGIGRCLCHDVFRSGRLQLARNTRECPRLPEIACAGRTESHACIPLRFEGGVLGVMNVATRPGEVFSDATLRFLETVGRQVCLSVDKSRTVRGQNRANAEARALAALARAVGGSLDYEHVLGAVGEYTRQLLDAERSAIFLDDGGATLQFAFLSGPPLAGLEVGHRADIAALGSRALLRALNQRKTLVIEDVSKDPRVNLELARKWDVGSEILVPLVAHDRLEGLLVTTRSSPGAWLPAQVDLADALGRQASVALENARLYREARDTLVRLQKAQEEMIKAERLAAIGTLAASLAHEVRNPLNSINLQLVLLQRKVGRLDEHERSPLTEPIETARAEIVRLEGLVQEFLTLSSIDRLSLVRVDPEVPVREVARLLAPLALERGVSIVEAYAVPARPIPLDPEKLKQALINLARNAVEAMPDGGILSLAIQPVAAGAEIRIADTGIGIPPDLDVFGLFQTNKPGGTGLGLPIARRIIEAHGGTIRYAPVPGGGTEFVVSLKSD